MLGHILGALIGVWLGLTLYNKQRKSELDAEIEQKQIFLNQKRKYLINTISVAKDIASKYKESVDKFAASIESDPLSITPLEQHPLQVFERFQKIVNNEEYFHAYLDKYGDSKETIDSFRNIAGASDFLDSQIRQLQILSLIHI